MRPIAFILILLIAYGCEKDLELSPSNDPEANLKNYTQTFNSQKIKEDLFAFAGKSPAFEKDSPNYPIHIYSIIRESAQEVRIYTSDSVLYPDSLELFTETQLNSEPITNGFFTRFLDNDTTIDRLIRICYRNADSLHISKSIQLNVTTRNTLILNSIIREVNSQGYLSFDWSAAPATTFHFLTMSDPSKDLLFAVQTKRSDFSFYDLRFVDHVFYQAENSPELVPGLRYTFSFFSIDNKGWLTARSSDTFIAE
jgi:hypothetical protein